MIKITIYVLCTSNRKKEKFLKRTKMLLQANII